MFTSVPYRHPALFLTGIMGGISFAACAKEADRPAAETRAPADTSGATGSAVASAAGASAEEPVTEEPVTEEPAKAPPPPKPSIDPGRKTSPKRITIPKTAVPPKDSTPAAAPTTAGADDQWLKYDAASNTVTFELIAGPFNFNGFTSGGATLIVPAKANVVMNFVNKDGTPHSAQIISGDGPLPNAAVEAAIPRAYTNKVLEGLPQEGKDVMRFTVPESGQYRIFCGVPGHGLSGMWIWMSVDPSVKTPSFGPTKA
jgi:sulfocyanin